MDCDPTELAGDDDFPKETNNADNLVQETNNNETDVVVGNLMDYDHTNVAGHDDLESNNNQTNAFLDDSMDNDPTDQKGNDDLPQETKNDQIDTDNGNVDDEFDSTIISQQDIKNINALSNFDISVQKNVTSDQTVESPIGQLDGTNPKDQSVETTDEDKTTDNGSQTEDGNATAQSTHGDNSNSDSDKSNKDNVVVVIVEQPDESSPTDQLDNPNYPLCNETVDTPNDPLIDEKSLEPVANQLMEEPNCNLNYKAEDVNSEVTGNLFEQPETKSQVDLTNNDNLVNIPYECDSPNYRLMDELTAQCNDNSQTKKQGDGIAVEQSDDKLKNITDFRNLKVDNNTLLNQNPDGDNQDKQDDANVAEQSNIRSEEKQNYEYRISRDPVIQTANCNPRNEAVNLPDNDSQIEQTESAADCCAPEQKIESFSQPSDDNITDQTDDVVTVYQIVNDSEDWLNNEYGNNSTIEHPINEIDSVGNSPSLLDVENLAVTPACEIPKDPTNNDMPTMETSDQSDTVNKLNGLVANKSQTDIYSPTTQISVSSLTSQTHNEEHNPQKPSEQSAEVSHQIPDTNYDFKITSDAEKLMENLDDNIKVSISEISQITPDINTKIISNTNSSRDKQGSEENVSIEVVKTEEILNINQAIEIPIIDLTETDDSNDGDKKNVEVVVNPTVNYDEILSYPGYHIQINSVTDNSKATSSVETATKISDSASYNVEESSINNQNISSGSLSRVPNITVRPLIDIISDYQIANPVNMIQTDQYPSTTQQSVLDIEEQFDVKKFVITKAPTDLKKPKNISIKIEPGRKDKIIKKIPKFPITSKTLDSSVTRKNYPTSKPVPKICPNPKPAQQKKTGSKNIKAPSVTKMGVFKLQPGGVLVPMQNIELRAREKPKKEKILGSPIVISDSSPETPVNQSPITKSPPSYSEVPFDINALLKEHKVESSVMNTGLNIDAGGLPILVF
ncbi:hypothetical protein O0L34_g13471 [Tuta absoluta]|nr:hypothetical protein O0L34_g13471 [Tuta absoluta]